jgi:TPP-dependent indolepyruvate ferredoxin oxidoreductase alpha subunit/NADPH-dependent glutamate synthase beta subunit-like oxidoreductase
VNHFRGPVTVGNIPEQTPPNPYIKNPANQVLIPGNARRLHPGVEELLEKLRDYSEKSPFNFVSGSGIFGIITSGISYLYLKEIIQEAGIEDRIRILKLGFTHPLSENLIISFLKSADKVLVVEELEPFIEEAVYGIAWRNNIHVQILGKKQKILPLCGEFDHDIIKSALSDFTGIKIPVKGLKPEIPLPARPPVLCAGCPHRATFYAVKAAAGSDGIYPMDIGCYSLGVAAPLELADLLICMGFSVSGSGGVGYAAGADRPVVGFIGDSTFFHSGITGLINAVHNRQKFTLVIMDNGTTAMTGHQPHPGTGKDADLVPVDLISIVKSSGVSWVKTVNPFDLRETISAVKEAVAFDGVSVIISRAPCLFAMTSEEKEIPGSRYYEVNPGACSVCWLGDHKCSVEGTKQVNLKRAVRRLFDPEGSKHASENPACANACPANVCVQGYIARLQASDFNGAVEIIREQNPLVSVCGFVCTHPCEQECIIKDQAVKIRELKKFAALNAPSFADSPHLKKRMESAGKRGKHVGIAGSGPAGLAAAWELLGRGYDVTIYEKNSVAGGLLFWGIPEYRMPRDVLFKEIKFLTDMGIEIRCDCEIGKDISWKDFHDRHAAVIVCAGAQRGMSLGLEHEDASGIFDALKFLFAVNRGEKPEIGRKTAIIGGGDAAIDAARSAKKMSPDSDVIIFYRRDRDQMPAGYGELNEALKEGAKLELLCAPQKLHVKDNHISSVEFIRMILSEDRDSSGRRKPVPLKGSEFEREIDMLIVAIGQSIELNWIQDEDIQKNGLEKDGRIKIDPFTGQSVSKKIFAAGDAATGPKTVIDAIRSGRIAGYGVDSYFRGSDASASRLVPFQATKTINKHECGELSKGDLQKEALRCVLCGTCAACRNCIQNFACPAMSIINGKVHIDAEICTGCGVCVQICPNRAIQEKKRK